jgi:hypothetical protein
VKLNLVSAAFCLLWIKIGLTLLSFSTFRKLFQWLSDSGVRKDISETKVKQITWAVNTAANVLPLELLCLPRALAAKYLLRQVPFLTLEIGIEINPRNGFEAHAWVERNGQIIIGDWSDAVSYQRLWVWQ